MALEFSFSDISKFFDNTKKDENSFFDDTTKKITNSIEERKNEFIDFTNELKNNAKELIDTTADKKFEQIHETTAQTAKEISSLIENTIDKLMEKTGAVVSKVGTKISEVAIDVKEWILDVENWKKVGATVVNEVMALVKGLVFLVESLVDGLMLLNVLQLLPVTLCTGLYDIIKGIATGEFNWTATKGLWTNYKNIVTYGWTDKLFDKFYETKAGKVLDNYAYTPFKSDGVGCKVTEGIGYVAGIILISLATAGIGGGASVAGGTAGSVSSLMPTLSATFSGIAGLGKYTAEEWNKNDVTIDYNGQQQKLEIDYQKYLEITELGEGKSTTIEQQVKLEDGSISKITFKITKNGKEYNIVDNKGTQVEFKGLNESSTVKGYTVGVIKGLWESFQYWIGGKIGTGSFSKITEHITSPIAKEAAKSTIRVGLDTLTGVVEVPFQTLMAAFSEDMTLKEAFEASGGWEAIKSQALIASISSFGGEAFSFKGNLFESKAKLDAGTNTNVVKTNSVNVSSANAMQNIKPNSVDDQIALANYYTGKGNFAQVKIENIEDLNLKQLDNIKDPSNTFITLDGKDYSVAEMKTKLQPLDVGTNTNVVKPNTIDDQIALANYYTGKGNFAQVKIENIEDLNLKQLDNIKDPNNTFITLDGKEYSVAEMKTKLQHLDVDDSIMPTNQMFDIDTTAPMFDIDTTARMFDIDTTARMFDIDTTAPMFDIDTTARMFDIDTTAPMLDDLSPISLSQYTISEKLNKFYNLMNFDELSDSNVVDLCYYTLSNSIAKGNRYAEKILEKLINLKNQNPNFKMVAADVENCCWINDFDTLVMQNRAINIDDSGTFTHELGHCLFDKILGGKVPDNWDNIVTKARVLSSKGDGIIQLENSLKQASNDSESQAKVLFEDYLSSNYDMNISQYQDFLTTQYERILKNTQDLPSDLRAIGFNEKNIEEIMKSLDNNSIGARDLAIAQSNNELAYYYDDLYKTNYGDQVALSDITDAVYEGDAYNLNGKKLGLTYIHGEEYYLNNPKNFQFHEIIADYTQLKLTGNKDSIEKLRNAFGEDFVNFLEETFQKFVV